MNCDLISKAIVLLVSYREYTGDFRMANLCGEVVEALKAELAKPEQEFVPGLYSIDPHGDGYAIYRGRNKFHHGFNIGHLTEVTPDTVTLIEDSLNSQLAKPDATLISGDSKQEPVARFNWNEAKFEWLTEYSYDKHHLKPLYLAPPSKELAKPDVTLTDEGKTEQEPVGVVQRTSIAGYPMADSTGVEWLRQVSAGEKLYTSAEHVHKSEESIHEPVAWLYHGHLHEIDPSDWAEYEVTPLYKAPPRKEWVGLSSAEALRLAEENEGKYPFHVAYSWAVEQLLKEKNNE
jgi:hypothetical protein